jgi:tetratricopeptide (TPR) repeat protein
MRLHPLLACLIAVSIAGCKRNQVESISAVPANSPSHAQIPAAPNSVIIERDPLAYQHEEEKPVDHLELSRELKSQGEFEDALIQARCALFHEPEDAEALDLVAKLAELNGDRDLAAEALERLSFVEPDDAAPLIRRVRLLIAANRLKEARRVGLEAIDRDGDNPETYQVTGRAYLADEQVGMAIWMFQKAIELSPDHGYALNNLGLAYLRANRDEEALDVLVRAAQLLPHVGYVQNNLGEALRRVFAEAPQLLPRDLEAQLHVQGEKPKYDPEASIWDPCDATEGDSFLLSAEQ